jgi:hypothetical protein
MGKFCRDPGIGGAEDATERFFRANTPRSRRLGACGPCVVRRWSKPDFARSARIEVRPETRFFPLAHIKKRFSPLNEASKLRLLWSKYTA